MISVLVYGRNDARGYGMHKRVAISLNTIAEVMTAPTSEIIFVDYNTPNHLPTLPELIRDMLTEKARLRTRVLRVRPSVHARFADFSHLPVLEPIARNVGLRRSRPQNRWILSTNTDAIIVPPTGVSLCDVVRDLPGIHYGLPRFELPERLWEALDRLDPVGTIATVGAWGKKARLDEIVRGQGVVQFDNPGDFQLVRRSALFSIDGFDEEALLGWHVDHNLAHRLYLKYGREGDLSDRLRLYHCSHTRQATATHSHDRVENDVQRFVHQVREPAILRQRDVWGCIDDPIGEFDLQRATTMVLLDAIEDAVSPLQGQPLEASYSSKTYDSLWYDAGHVGVHLLDLVSTFPRGVTIGYAGCRRDLLDVLTSGLVALGFTEWLTVSTDAAERLRVIDGEGFRVRSVDHLISQCDLLIFEFGLLRDETGDKQAVDVPLPWTAEEAAALDHVATAFVAAVRHDRENVAAHSERMLIAVNAVNSRFETLVSSSIDATPSPFTTRLRYGLASGSKSPDMPAANPSRPSHRAVDVAAARNLLTVLLDDGFDKSVARLTLASYARLIRDLINEGAFPLPPGVTKASVLARLDIVQSPPPEYSGFPPKRPSGSSRHTAVSRLASQQDFEAPDWLAAARRVRPAISHGRIRRDGLLWERAQIMWGLQTSLVRSPRDRALLVSERPDEVVPALADMFARLDVIDVRALTASDAPLLLRAADFGCGPHLFGEKIQSVPASDIVGASYDAIIIPHSAAFRLGVCALGPLISRLRTSMKSGCVVAIGGEIAMTGSHAADRPNWRAACAEGFPRALANHAGLILLGDDLGGVEREDAALVGSLADRDAGLPVLGVRRDGEIFWPAVWFFEATDDDIALSDLDASIAALVMGDQMRAVSLAAQTELLPGVLAVQGGHGEGHIFYGPYLRLLEGRYQARVVVTRGERAHGGVRLVAEVVVGAEILIQQQVMLDAADWNLPVLFEMPFVITAEASIRGAALPCEIRLWSNGNAPCEVREITLELADL